MQVTHVSLFFNEVGQGAPSTWGRDKNVLAEKVKIAKKHNDEKEYSSKKALREMEAWKHASWSISNGTIGRGRIDTHYPLEGKAWLP